MMGTGNQTESGASTERRSDIGLYKRQKVWWMRFSYQGRQISKSMETEDQKQAQRIYDKVKYEIAEGKWFEKKPEHSFKKVMDQ
jgi:hypothetical protein